MTQRIGLVVLAATAECFFFAESTRRLAILPRQSVARPDISAIRSSRCRDRAIEGVAARLGNTPTICRKCYVHPVLIDTYLKGSLLLEVKSHAESELREEIAGLTPEEVAVTRVPPRRNRQRQCREDVRTRATRPGERQRPPPEIAGGEVS
jgi:hypothetical protein